MKIEKDKNIRYIKKWMIFFIGTAVMGFGMQLCNLADLGMDPLGIFQTGTARRLGISFGGANILICIFFIAVSFVINRKDITVMTLASPFICSLGIGLVPDYFAGLHSLVLFPTGLTLMAVGIAVSIHADCGKTAYDCFIYGFMRIFKKSYAAVRFCTDACLAAFGVLMKGSIGIGTIAACVCLGKMMEFVLRNLEKYAGELKK